MNKNREIEKIDKCINELVYQKTALRKAYNYYHGVRDAEQFKYLEDNFGIGVPTSVTFTPLMKKHIDVLVGEYLELDSDMSVTCKDDETVSKIQRDKQLKINLETSKFLNKYLQNSIINILLNSQNPINDPFIEKELERIKLDVENSFESDYEIAAQNIILYIKHNRELDIKNKLRELLTDLLIGGCCYYRAKPSIDKKNLRYDVLNPLDTFVERNPNSFFLNKSRRAVIRRWMTYDEIMEEFGDDLSNKDRADLNEYYEDISRFEPADHIIVESSMDTLLNDGDIQRGPTPGILAGLEVHPIYPDSTDDWYNTLSSRTIPVYECQWLEYDKELKRSVLHEGVKIGDKIYITNGEPEYYIKSKSDPKSCKLNLNGMFFNDKNGQPFSLIQSTMNLQD